MAFSLRESIQQNQASQENQFFTNLLQFAMNATPEFDITGKSPVMISKGAKLPPKSVLWNQYVQLKKGRVSPQDMMKFEQVYKQVKSTMTQENIKKINQLGLRGYSDTKIQQMMNENPEMYQNMLDMVSEYQSMGTPEGLAAAETLKSYLPQKSMVGEWREGFEDAPVKTAGQAALVLGGGTLAGVGAYKLGKPMYVKGKGWVQGPEPQPKFQHLLDKGTIRQSASGQWQRRSGGKWHDIKGKKILAQLDEQLKIRQSPTRYRRAANWIAKRGLGQIGGAVSKGFTADLAGMGVGIGSGLLGASPDTSRRLDEATSGVLQAGMAWRGLSGLSKVPHPIPRAVGYGGLALMGLWNLFSAAGEE